MFCKKCGKELAEGVRYCDNCGQAVDESIKVIMVKEKMPKEPKKPKSGLGLAIVANIFSFFLLGFDGEDIMVFSIILISPFFVIGLILALTNLRKDKPRCITVLSILAASLLIAMIAFYISL